MLMHCDLVCSYFTDKYVGSHFSFSVSDFFRSPFQHILPTIGNMINTPEGAKVELDSEFIAEFLARPDIELKYKKNVAHIVTYLWSSTSVDTYCNYYENYRLHRANRIKGLV